MKSMQVLKHIIYSLWKLSGEDFAIIKDCSPKLRFYFSAIGAFVMAILICCFLSAMYFTDHLFHNKFLDVGIGLVWGYIITNMYVLLLYTITPTLLPVKEKKKQGRKFYPINFSMGLRIFIVILLAIITAQPLNIFLLKSSSVAFANDIKFLLAHNPLATLITIFVIVIFILPIHLKYRIRKLGEFYEKKALINKRIIKDDYEIFKEDFKYVMEQSITKYNKKVWRNLEPSLMTLKSLKPKAYRILVAEIENELIKENISKFEYWADPPYRTIRKKSYEYKLSESDLLKHIYPDIN